MSLREQQHFLARLYTDPAFREEFNTKPQEVGIEFGLTETEVIELAQLARHEVKRFSDSLIWKRLQEVEKMLPATRQLMGDSFGKAFFDFAPGFNPQGIKKHYVDAVEFCTVLAANNSFPKDVRRAATFESTRLSFFNQDRTFAMCRSRNGVLGLAVWLRVAGRVFHFTI